MIRSFPAATVLGAMLVLGCEGDLATPTDGAGSTAAPATDESRGGEARRVVHQVRWPAAASADRAARAGLSDAARRQVDRATVPVLVPPQLPWLGRAVVISKAHWTAVAIAGDGLAIALRAIRLAQHYDRIEPAQGPWRVRGAAAFVGRHARIPTVSWMENGVAYSLDLECSGADDPRCADAAYLLDLAESLAYVGGRGSGLDDGDQQPEAAR